MLIWSRSDIPFDVPRLLLKSFFTALWAVAILVAREQSDVAAARAIDREIRQLKTLPEDVRARAIKRLAGKIEKQPVQYAVSLAFNLDVDGRKGSDSTTLQVLTTALGNSLTRLPPSDTNHSHDFESLAELIRYEHTNHPREDARLKAAMAKLQRNDAVRAVSGFTLRDLHGKEWNLKSLSRLRCAPKLLGHLVSILPG